MNTFCCDCHEMRDCRPAGPEGAMICGPCALKHPEELKKYVQKEIGLQDLEVLSGEGIASVITVAIGKIIKRAFKFGVLVKKIETSVTDETIDSGHLQLAFHIDQSRFNQMFSQMAKPTSPSKPDSSIKYDA